MHIHNNTMLVSLGSSCAAEAMPEFINKNYNLGLTYKSGIFDWVIISPKSIVQFLRYIKTGIETRAIVNRSNYIPVKSTNGRTYYKNKRFDCFYIWHSETYDKNFVSKSIHKIRSLMDYDGQICFILKNNSVQIAENMLSVGEDPDKFIISYEVYQEICSLAKELFNAEVILRTNKELISGFPEDYELDKPEMDLQEIKDIFNID